MEACLEALGDVILADIEEAAVDTGGFHQPS